MAARADLCIVTLGVQDVGRSVAFYEALGWERAASSMAEIAWFRTPHSFLGLYGREALAEDARVPAGTPGAFGGIKRPERTPWGGYSGYFADPDGHPWEVAFNPGFPIGEDGRLEIP